jgi:hypothetical protein
VSWSRGRAGHLSANRHQTPLEMMRTVRGRRDVDARCLEHDRLKFFVGVYRTLLVSSSRDDPFLIGFGIYEKSPLCPVQVAAQENVCRSLSCEVCNLIGS